MKKLLLALFVTACVNIAGAQTTYYWVGGAASANINTGANWNTSLDGSGSARPSSTGATDILVFNGTNLGGPTPVTGPITVHANAGITFGALKFINNCNVSFVRNTTGTSTLTISGVAGDDFYLEAGSSFSITSTTGSIVLAMAAANTGTVAGNFSMITPLQARIANTTGGSPNSLIFVNGSKFYTNITAASAAYAFGNSSQSSEKWVTFQPGAQLFYDGGYSPMGSSASFSPVNFLPGSIWHHRATNALTGFGSFFNTKSFANIIVENGATLNADGPIYRIDTLTITAGSNFVPHTSGSTVITGNLVVDGAITAQAVKNNTLLFAGTVPQVISGSGTIANPSLTVADNAIVVLNRNISGLDTAVNIYGKINFNTYQLTGAGSFTARANASVSGLTGTLTSGSAQITTVAGTIPNLIGMTVTGTGIPANTIVVNYSASAATINLSKPATASGTLVALTVLSDTAVLQTSNPNGFDATLGSVAMTGTKTYQAGTSYIIDGATTTPFGISTGSTGAVDAGFIEINAPVTTNTSLNVIGYFQLNAGKVTIRTIDTVRILSSANITGSFSNSNYFVTSVDNTTGAKGVLRIDGITSTRLAPIGSVNYYMPAYLNPASVSDVAFSVFEGITNNGDPVPLGVLLAGPQKQTKVDAVWNLQRISGTGGATLQLNWPQALEGTTFSTMADSMIGIIHNPGSSWTLPLDTGNNVTNVATASIVNFGAYGVGAKPPAQAFVFNPLPNKIYGDADFNGGAISLNSSQPIVYASSNPAVASIVNNDIHITGVGNTTITATQASDGFYPAVSSSQSLTVNKAPLTIKADDKTKPQGDPNPALTVSYTGFVYGQTSSALSSPVILSTTAITSSPAGTYPIVASGAVAANYNITFVNGTMTVTPRQNQVITFNAFPTKTYGNNNFPTGASSNNNTIPITYTSSNPLVAIVVGSNVQIVGAGTTVITASQAGNAFYYAAPNVSQTLTVNKANLNVRVADTTRLFGQPNPPFTIIYTGFVLGENAGALISAPTPGTIATIVSAPNYYAIVALGGVSNNYNFVYTNGRLTVLPATGTTQTFFSAYMTSRNSATVTLYSPEVDLGDIYIYDMMGTLIRKKNVYIGKGFMNYNIEVKMPAPGIYNVVLVSKNLELKTTLVVIRP